MSVGAGRRAARDQRQDYVAAHRAARRLALAAVFEADFGQRTATTILERHLAATGADPETSEHARSLVGIVVARRDKIDATISRVAPRWPVVQLAPIDRAILRLAVGEVLHSPATPARVAIAEWVELARTFSGDPARRLVNGILGTISREQGPGPSRTEGTAGGS
jgi:transcription antitermination protein NusB